MIFFVISEGGRQGLYFWVYASGGHSGGIFLSVGRVYKGGLGGLRVILFCGFVLGVHLAGVCNFPIPITAVAN